MSSRQLDVYPHPDQIEKEQQQSPPSSSPSSPSELEARQASPLNIKNCYDFYCGENSSNNNEITEIIEKFDPEENEEGLLSSTFSHAILNNSKNLLKISAIHKNYKKMMNRLKKDFHANKAREIFLEKISSKLFINLCNHFRAKHMILELIKNCNSEQLEKIIMEKITTPNLHQFAIDRHSSILLQSIFSNGDLKLQLTIIHLMKDHLIDISKNKYGNYLISLMFEKLSLHVKHHNLYQLPVVLIEQYIHFLLNHFLFNINHFYNLCNDKYGSYILEICINYCVLNIKYDLLKNLLSIHVPISNPNNNIDFDSPAYAHVIMQAINQFHAHHYNHNHHHHHHHYSLLRCLALGKQSNYVVQKLLSIDIYDFNRMCNVDKSLIKEYFDVQQLLSLKRQPKRANNDNNNNYYNYNNNIV